MPATAGTLSVAGTNGGISVEGEARGDVGSSRRSSTTAETDARAREILAAVQLNPTLDQVGATGPQTRNREGWSVSYRLYVPRALNMNLRTTNGGISIRDIDSKVEFRTTNGGVKLTAVNGDVKGRTTNGGVDIDLDGSFWSGEGLDVETTNGGVKLSDSRELLGTARSQHRQRRHQHRRRQPEPPQPRRRDPARLGRRADSRADDEWRCSTDAEVVTSTSYQLRPVASYQLDANGHAPPLPTGNWLKTGN